MSKEELIKNMEETAGEMMLTSFAMMEVYGEEHENASELKGASIMLFSWVNEIKKEI